MVRKIFNFFLYFLFFIVALLYFTPKIGLYYLVEEKSKPLSGVIISKEKLIDNGFSLDIENANVSIKGIDSAIIKNIDIKFLLLYTSINIKGITLSSVANSFLPLDIDRVTIEHSIFHPLVVKGSAKGGFGTALLDISFNPKTLQRHLKLILKPSSKMKQNYKRTIRNLKKNKEGEYIYEKNI